MCLVMRHERRLSNRSVMHGSVLAGMLCAALAGVCVWTPAAQAQGIPSAVEDARDGEEIRGDTGVVKIHEVERGWYFGVDMGINYYIPIKQAGFVNINPTDFGTGARMGLRFGYDLLNNVRLEGFLLANYNQGVLDADKIVAGELTGDISHYVPGVGVRFDFLTTERLFGYVRGGVGYAMWLPAPLAGGSFGSLHVDASGGIEYYTQLRHISVGLEFAAQALIAPTAIGFQLYPTFKYTF